MKAFTLQSIAALALVAAFAGPAAAASTSHGSGNILQDVQSAISDGSSNVRVSVTDRVATLTGYTRSISRDAAVRAALANPEIDQVIDLIVLDS